MKDGKFKSLVIDTYKRKLVGILYGAVSTYGFSDIKDIDGFVETSNPDMLYLKSPYWKIIKLRIAKVQFM